MNALDMARTAYTSSAAPIRTERGIEYDAFARVTHRLKTANPGIATTRLLSRPCTRTASFGRCWPSMWPTPRTSLPQGLRAQIFYLAEFTAAPDHKDPVLATPSPDALIEINTAIMRGLRQQGEQP